MQTKMQGPSETAPLVVVTSGLRSSIGVPSRVERFTGVGEARGVNNIAFVLLPFNNN